MSFVSADARTLISVLQENILNWKDPVSEVLPKKLQLKKDFIVPHELCCMRISDVEIVRSNAFEKIIEVAEASKVSIHDKTKNALISIFSSPGGGKSFCLDQLAEHVMSSQKESCLTGSLILTISYNGSCHTPAQNADNCTEFGLAVRILWSYFIDITKASYLDFVAFWQYLEAACPTLGFIDALRVVISHASNPRILLLLDELLQIEQYSKNSSLTILSCIGRCLEGLPDFFAVVSSLQISTILRLESVSGRVVEWIPLSPFTPQQSEQLLNAKLSSFACNQRLKDVFRLCISDIGGHPRSLQYFAEEVDKIYARIDEDTEPEELVDIILTGLSRHFMFRTMSWEMISKALRGERLPLTQSIGSSTIEKLISDGTYLNSEVVPGKDTVEIVPRLSIMQLRIYTKLRRAEYPELVKCLNETVVDVGIVEAFGPTAFERFHAQWEVLIRCLGFGLTQTLAEFYTRDLEDFRTLPRSTREIVIDFRQKRDGVLDYTDPRSIFQDLSGSDASRYEGCSAIYMAKPAQAGFDSFYLEKKAGGGFVAVFVDNKYSRPGSNEHLKSSEFSSKLNHCEEFVKTCWLFGSLHIKEDDCYLVLASWREGEASTLRREIRKSNQRIILLSRRFLSQLYSPTLVSRPFFLAGDEQFG